MTDSNSNWLYLNSPTNSHRYILGETGEKILACIGVNPSTAEPENLDNTLKSVKRIANSNGFDGWIMYNLYPQRATHPIDMDEEIDHNQNLKNYSSIVKSIKHLKIDTLWLAWGDLIDSREYLIFCLYKIYETIKNEDLKLKFAIIDVPTVAGNPKHPLYKKSNSELYEFDLKKYIDSKITKAILKKYDGITLNGYEFK